MITREMRQTICEQIGVRIILSISGGHVMPTDTGVAFPVSAGYTVHVAYNEGADDYTVTRILKRAGKEFIEGQREHVYREQLGKTVYRASRFFCSNEKER